MPQPPDQSKAARPKITEPFDPLTTTRPVRALLTHYTIICLFTLILFPITFGIHLCKYLTLQYKFDDKGITMSWGVLFRREIYLTYRRIQDIHVSRGIIQRWLGIATVSVQTASGSAGAQMSIEGIGDPQGLRDFLYGKMRGGSLEAKPTRDAVESEVEIAASGGSACPDEMLVVLNEILDEVKALRMKQPDGGRNDA